MKSVILCEGQTDAVLIGYYLGALGWKFYKDSSKVDEAVDGLFSFPVQDERTEIATWFRKDGRFLAVWGVGGESKFEYAYSEVMRIHRRVEQRDGFHKVAIVTDRDQSATEEIRVDALNRRLSQAGEPVVLGNREWNTILYLNDFGDETTLSLLCLVLPAGKKGALETFMLDALAENAEEKIIVDSVRHLVANIQSDKYLQTERKKLKAEFDATLALMHPGRVFAPIHKVMLEVPWEQYKTVVDGFELLDSM